MAKLILKTALGIEIPTIEVVDVGAMVEETERYVTLVEQGIARITGFEPNAQEFEKLKARRGPYRYLPHVLGRGGPATLHLTRYPGCTSLYEPDPAVIDLFVSIGAGPGGNFQVIRTERVETRRLDDLEECPRADYLKVDVQGAELDVLEGARTLLAGVLVVEAEVEFVALYKNQPLFGEVQAFMREHGFALHKMIDVAGRAFKPLAPTNPYQPTSQLLWADAVFVKDFTRLAAYSDAGLLKAAAILGDVYRSYDLCLFLLRALDSRKGTALAQTYLKAIQQAPSLDVMFMNVKAEI